MAKIAKQLTELVGNTPLLELNKYSTAKGLETPVIAKVEFFNPGGSVKDRIALAMIEDAEAKGILKPGATIIEPTSGNTGVGLALVSAVKGYHLILTMPETMSVERSCATRFLVLSSCSSSRTQPTPPSTMPPQVLRYGATQTARSTSSLVVWALVEPSVEQENT